MHPDDKRMLDVIAEGLAKTDPITVPMEARQAMQKALWERCIRPGENEWTTWTDAIILAEAAATALWEAGWTVVRSDSWRLRSDFDVVPHIDGSVCDV